MNKMTNRIMEMYQQIPQILTQRYEIVEESDSLVLQKAPLTVELSEHEGSGALFQANLMAPLRAMKDPQEGIDALTTLKDRRELLHWNGYEGTFGNYGEGVEVCYKFGVDQKHLQRALRDFSFPDYKFRLDVDLEHCIDPRAKRFTGYIVQTDGKIILFGENDKTFNDAARMYVNKSLEENPTMRLGSCGISRGLVTHIELEAEDKQTLANTEVDLRKILNDTYQRDDLELVVTRKVRDKP